MTNKTNSDMRIYSLKIQVQTITDNITELKRIRKETSDRLFEAEQEKFALVSGDEQ